MPQEKIFVNSEHSTHVLYQLSELWRDKKFCDATIEVGPVKVYVHRLVLVAACPYLLTIGGQHDACMLEVKLPMTVGLEGLNVFLTYLYDGVLNLTTGNLDSVEKLADILQVQCILKFCKEFRNILTTEKDKNEPTKTQSDYSLNMTESSLQIIFSEVLTAVSDLKREPKEFSTYAANEMGTPSKRARVSVDSLAPSVHNKQFEKGHQVENTVQSSRKSPRQGRNQQKNMSSSSDTEHTQVQNSPSVVHIKQEPFSDTEDSDRAYTTTSGNFSKNSEEAATSTFTEQSLEDSNTSETRFPVAKNNESAVPETFGLGTSSEIGEDNQPRDEMDYDEMEELLESDFEENKRQTGRFKNLSELELQRLEIIHQSEGTKKNTKWGVSLFQDWSLEALGYQVDFHTISAEELNIKLRKFYAEAQPKNIQKRAKFMPTFRALEYTRNTLNNIRAAINRHLHDIDRDFDIVRDGMFRGANKMLDRKAKANSLIEQANPQVNKTSIDPDDLEKIKSYLQSPVNPVVLRYRVWYDLSVHFANRDLGFHKLKRSSFLFCTDPDGNEYVTLSDDIRPIKSQSSTLSFDASHDERMYATDDEHCPVASLHMFLDKNQPEAEYVFNLCDKTALASPGTTKFWYTCSPYKWYRFSRFMSEICKNSKCSQTYTARFLRKTTIQQMKYQN